MPEFGNLTCSVKHLNIKFKFKISQKHTWWKQACAVDSGFLNFFKWVVIKQATLAVGADEEYLRHIRYTVYTDNSRTTHWLTKGHLTPGRVSRATVRREGSSQTYAAIEMLAADMGLTSFTSRAFCRASFLLAASSCSSSSFGEQWEARHKTNENAVRHVGALCVMQGFPQVPI